MTSTGILTAEVANAIDELTETFGELVTATPDADGGAWVVIEGISLGQGWNLSSTWLGFHIATTYPYADVYPHFIDAGCALADNCGLPAAVSSGGQFPGRTGACIQISRKSNRWDPTRDTATLKALKVIDWLRSP